MFRWIVFLYRWTAFLLTCKINLLRFLEWNAQCIYRKLPTKMCIISDWVCLLISSVLIPKRYTFPHEIDNITTEIFFGNCSILLCHYISSILTHNFQYWEKNSFGVLKRNITTSLHIIEKNTFKRLEIFTWDAAFLNQTNFRIVYVTEWNFLDSKSLMQEWIIFGGRNLNKLDVIYNEREIISFVRLTE